jgi:phosphoribosylamine---glycine ligase
MKVAIIGSGGREHALAWKISQSPQCDQLYAIPGNAGMADLAECVPQISATDIDAIVRFVQEQEIGFTIVGPEQPLVDGIVDRFQEEGLRISGPTRAAAQLEGSKVFSKRFMQRHAIPTARFEVFDDLVAAQAHLEQLDYPYVIKVDGLAAGKGVLLPDSLEEAHQQLQEIMADGKFGTAGQQVVIEERLEGPEASVFVLVRGDNYWLLPGSTDHKRAYDDDRGPNTGGMGAIAPTPLLDEQLMQRVDTEIVRPTIAGLQADGIPYDGFLFLGLMLTEDGPSNLEYNCRFGDPEAQVLLPLMEEDLLEALLLPQEEFTSRRLKTDRYAATVVLASGGYPGSYATGVPITGIDSTENGVVYHAGTKLMAGQLVTAGGRVLALTALGDTLTDAIETAYSEIEKIDFEHKHYRTDIGRKAL